MNMHATAGGDPAERLVRALAHHVPDYRGVTVAFSGGADSTALLQVAAEALPRRRIRAVHVHHGWHESADDWSRHCRAAARELGLRCDIERVDSAPRGGEGPEAAARAARYAALRARMGSREVLLTAHQREDQAETLLLALLRGGGVHGWAGMPECRPLGPGWHLRPWLGIRRATLIDLLEQRGLHWLDDPANHDPRHDRVWLREQVMPLLRQRHPEVDATLARAAAFAGEAAASVDALAAHDFVICRGRRNDTIDCAALATLPALRQRALLRWWLGRAGLSLPPAAQLESLRCQLLTAAGDRNPRVAWHGAEVRRWRGEAWALAPQVSLDPAAEYAWPNPTRPLALPHRSVTAADLAALGVSPDEGQRVRIAFRRGGERLPRSTGGTVALKRWLAASDVPPWERGRLPLVYLDDRLVGVIGVAPP